MTEPFCTITTDRGDRAQYFHFCQHQLARMTIQPQETFFINHEPLSDAIDITMRVRLGIAAAEKAGIDICYIVESDDFYGADYFETMAIGDNDFIGASKSLYYNVKNSTYQEFNHPTRSSLYCTGFRISALKRFSWPPNDTRFLDLILWKYALKYRHKLIDSPVAVGIKHGIGMTGGNMHKKVMQNKDPDYSFLKSKVDTEAYAFYRSL